MLNTSEAVKHALQRLEALACSRSVSPEAMLVVAIDAYLEPEERAARLSQGKAFFSPYADPVERGIPESYAELHEALPLQL